MKGLLMDTSSATLYAAVAIDGKTIAKREIKDAQRKQSELLLPTIKELLQEAGVSAKEIDYVVAGKGPGSYTGLRISLTASKVFALSLNIPLYLCSTLSLLRSIDDRPTICLLDAKANRSYIGIYEGDKCLLADQAMSNGDVISLFKEHSDYLVSGQVAQLGLDGIAVIDDPTIENLARGNKEENLSDALSAKPVYLKETYATPNL